jgi:aspartate aminotransferase
MRRTPAGRRPAVTDSGLPVPPELSDRLAASRDAAPQPPGGDLTVRTAACGYWQRRGAPVTPDHVLVVPGPAPLLPALLAAVGGDLVLPRPAAPWYAPPAWLAGRRTHFVPTPAECGGVPDPVALLETVRRARGEGARPSIVVLAVADDPTGTVAPPEVVHEVCEAAAGADLLVVSDETFHDVPHDPLTVVLGPAEIAPEHTVVLADLAGGLLPSGWPVAIARFPREGPAAAARCAVREVLAAQRALPAGPLAEAAALALAEPPALRRRTEAANRLHATVATAVHADLLRLGALCLPPRAGFHLYPDFSALRPRLAAQGVRDQDALAERLPGAVAGHRLGDDPGALRVRIAVSALYGRTPKERESTLRASDPLRVPHVAEALAGLGRAFTELTAA